MSDKNIQRMQVDAKELVATLPADKLRSIFYLFSSKPDSRIKVFEQALYNE